MDSENDGQLAKLSQEVAKARSELKHIKQQNDGLRLQHKKDVRQIKDIIKRADLSRGRTSDFTEKGASADSLWHFKPIGHVKSVFKYKNGIPRQANVCETSKATVTLERDLYSNPEHSLEGLEQYSHIWVIFLFHKNSNSFSKAKVAPPRLNGARVGLFSTRSPHRPNAVGLSLVKLDNIEGSTLYLSGVDLLDGTPVLDIKPYIPDYDMPQTISQPSTSTDCTTQNYDMPRTIAQPTTTTDSRTSKFTTSSPLLVTDSGESATDHSLTKEKGKVQESHYHCNQSGPSSEVRDSSHSKSAIESSGKNSGSINSVAAQSMSCSPTSEVVSSTASLCDSLPDTTMRNVYALPNTTGSNSSNNAISSNDVHVSESKVAEWIREPPITRLDVIFTPWAEEALSRFSKNCPDACYRTSYLEGPEEIKAAVVSILSADPRSAYRRQHCTDRLYYFRMDRVHVTCWFNGDTAEVVSIKPNNRE